MSDKPRIVIKVIGNVFAVGPSRTVVGSRYEFVYDRDCTDYDWLVVYDEMPCSGSGVFCNNFEQLRCPREHTILCTWEPVSIKSYSRDYTRQFGHLLTNRPREAEKHPGYHLGRGYFVWFVHDIGGSIPIEAKQRSLSVVCSLKCMRHTLHYRRYELIRRLSEMLPNMDWYGHGVRPLERKESALVPYKYHIAVENHIGVHHWTEKFADAILCECLPFYAGDPAIREIFPHDCYIPIPIDDPEAAADIIRSAIAADEYSRRRGAILEAKRLILEKYNFWQQVIDVIESVRSSESHVESDNASRIYARRALRWRSLSALCEDCCDRIRRSAGRFFRGVL